MKKVGIKTISTTTMAKAISLVLTLVIALGLVMTVAFSSFAASNATFTMKVKEETSDNVTIVVELTDGEFCNADMVVKGGSSVGKCISAYDADAYSDFQKNIKKAGGQAGSAAGTNTKSSSSAAFSCASTSATQKGTEVFECVFEKKSSDKVTASDFNLEVETCGLADKSAVSTKVVNNIPTSHTTSTTKSTTSATKSTTSATKSTTSATKSTTSATKSTTSATKSTTSTTKSTTSTTKSTTSTTKSSTPATSKSTSETTSKTGSTVASTNSTATTTSAAGAVGVFSNTDDTTSAGELDGALVETTEYFEEDIEYPEIIDNEDETQEPKNQIKKIDKKKLVVIACAAVAGILIVAGVAVVVINSLKNKNIENEPDVNVMNDAEGYYVPNDSDKNFDNFNNDLRN